MATCNFGFLCDRGWWWSIWSMRGLRTAPVNCWRSVKMGDSWSAHDFRQTVFTPSGTCCLKMKRGVVMSYIYFVTFTWVIFWVTNTFRVYYFTLTQIIFWWKNGTFTSLLWATLLLLLHLNAIQVKMLQFIPKASVYFSLGNERCPFVNDSFFWVNFVQKLDQTSWQTSESVRESVWMIRSVSCCMCRVVWSGSHSERKQRVQEHQECWSRSNAFA